MENFGENPFLARSRRGVSVAGRVERGVKGVDPRLPLILLIWFFQIVGACQCRLWDHPRRPFPAFPSVNGPGGSLCFRSSRGNSPSIRPRPALRFFLAGWGKGNFRKPSPLVQLTPARGRNARPGPRERPKRAARFGTAGGRLGEANGSTGNRRPPQQFGTIPFPIPGRFRLFGSRRERFKPGPKFRTVPARRRDRVGRRGGAE